MRRFHPVKVLRRSGWRSRAALAVVVAGVIAGPLGAGPAAAHGTGLHTVVVRGKMTITDVDGGPLDPFPDICTVEVTQSASARRTSSNPNPRINIDIVRDCDEATGFLRVNATLRSDTKVNGDGFARVNERNCIIGRPLCAERTVGNRDYTVTWLENTTGQGLKTRVGRTDLAFVDFDFEVVIVS